MEADMDEPMTYREARKRLMLAKWHRVMDMAFARALGWPPEEPEWVEKLPEDLRKLVRSGTGHGLA